MGSIFLIQLEKALGYILAFWPKKTSANFLRSWFISPSNIKNRKLLLLIGNFAIQAPRLSAVPHSYIHSFQWVLFKLYCFRWVDEEIYKKFTKKLQKDINLPETWDFLFRKPNFYAVLVLVAPLTPTIWHLHIKNTFFPVEMNILRSFWGDKILSKTMKTKISVENRRNTNFF